MNLIVKTYTATSKRRISMDITKEVAISSSDKSLVLQGILSVPKGSQGIVVFAHGSGSSRHSPRNQFVANIFVKSNMATLLMDLLTPEEEEVDSHTRHLRFNIELLAERLNFAAEWLADQQEINKLKVGLIGSSTGAAAALVSASENAKNVAAVVSRGGRPDLAGDALPLIKAPTLLIVGSQDFDVIKLNQEAFDKMKCVKKIEIVQGATHLFEEQGTLEEAARLSKEWFLKYFRTKM
jgi:putative phosphoribosyl transferase